MRFHVDRMMKMAGRGGDSYEFVTSKEDYLGVYALYGFHVSRPFDIL
jgi:hypothetical protein